MNWNMFPWRSLKTRVTLFTLAIFLAGIWSLAFYAGRMLREDMQRLSGEQQFSTVSLLAAEVDDELDSRLRALETVARSVTPAMLGKPADLQALLEQRPILQSLFNGGLIAFRRNGTVIADVPRLAGRIGLNFMKRDFVATALEEGKSTIGRPVMGKVLHSPIFTMTVPIRDAQGKVMGALAGVINLGLPNFLGRIMDQRYGRTGGYLLIAPQYRLIVTASDKSRIMEELPAAGVLPMMDRFLQGSEGPDIFVNPLGVEQLNSSKSIPVAGWKLAAVLPTEEAFAPILDMQRRMLLAALFLTLLAGGLTWWMLRRQLAPMLAAVTTLATLSDTDQPVQPLAIARQDEIGELIGGFNRLLETLGRREVALRESEERFRSIVQNAEGVIVIRDADGAAIYVSPQCERVTGYPPETFLGKKRVNLVHPEDRARYSEAREKLHRTGQELRDLEHRIALPDGGYRWLTTTAGRITLPDGTHGVQSNVRDITSRKRAELALRESEERFRSIVQNAEGAILIRNASGEAIYASPQCERVLGYPAEAFLGRTRLSLIHPQDRSPWEEAWEKLHRTGEGFRDYEHRIVLADGSYRWMSSTAGSIALPDGTRGVQTNVRDITERKRTDSMLVQRTAEVKAAYRKLAETEEQERRALARELHDQVGQNLTALNLNLNRLNIAFADSLASESRARVSDSLALVEDTAQRIRDIMSFLRPPILDDYGLFATLRWWAHESATRSGIAIELTGAEAEPRLPNNVELTLFRVAQEALRNAIKHSGAKHIMVSLEMLPAFVRLVISDDGRGMVADAGAAALGRSTWGILNMRERAEAIGGSLRVESAPGAGVRVVVEVAREQP